MRFVRVATLPVLAALVSATPHSTFRSTGTAIPITKHSSFTKDDGTVDLGALNSCVTLVKAKINRCLKNFEKNTGYRHSCVTSDLDLNYGAGLPLIDAEDNGFWYGSISVGTPPQNFTVLIDTGSTDLFLPSSGCHSNCKSHNLWDATSSSTAIDTGMSFSIDFGIEGNVTGELYTDTVSIAGFTATNQDVGAALTYPPTLQISNFPVDGLMGMAFKSVSEYNSTSMFGTLVDQEQVMDPVFSVKLSEYGSELYIGGVNFRLYVGDFAYTPVVKEGFWEVNMDNLQVNGRTYLTNTNVVIDTGTTLVIGPSKQVAALYKAIGGKLIPGNQGGDFYSFPCDRMPIISFAFGGKSFPIPERALNLGPISSGSHDCISGISGLNLSHSFWIIGDIFLSGVYTTFDYRRLQVGFAALA